MVLVSEYVAATKPSPDYKIVRNRKGGRNVVPSPALNSSSTNGCAVTKGSKIGRERVRGLTEIGLTTGKVRGAMKGVDQHRCYSRREMRGLAIRVLRNRGLEATDENIAGILSGKTL